MAGTEMGRSEPASTPPVRDTLVTLNGMRFHYRDWGSPQAPPLVVLHGYTGNARHWDTFAQAMADRYRVLALDQRGHGETDWAPDQDYLAARVIDDFAAFVAALGLQRFAAVGFSFGCEVAYAYAAAHPDRVERLVLVEPGDPPDTPAVHAHVAALRSLPTVLDAPDEAVRSFAAAGLAPYAPADELRHWVLTGLKPLSDGRWTWRLDPVLQRPDPQGRERLTHGAEVMWHLLPAVACPTLLVRGAETAHTPIDDVERMAAVMPDARVVSIPRAGHWTPLDNPGGFLAVVGQFLNGEE
jgi:pimeloyl-ACP methyl ester carboxylesterase